MAPPRKKHGLSGPKNKFKGGKAPAAQAQTAVKSPVVLASSASESASDEDERFDEPDVEDEAVLESPDDDDDGDGDDDDEEVEEDGSKEDEAVRWGKSAKAYYKEGESEDDSMDEDDELKEAIRLQRAREGQVQDRDYDIMSENDDDDDDARVTAPAKTPAVAHTDVEMLAAEAPEVLALLGEMQTNVAAVSESLNPVLERLRSGESKTSLGVALMETKLHLLLSYTLNVAFYLLLRAEGGGARAESHPVVSEMVRLRTALDKLRPLDAKLKAHLDALAQRLHAAEKDDGDDDDDGDAAAGARRAAASGRDAPPALEALETIETAMTRADALPDKRQRRERKRLLKVRDSAVLKGLRTELADAPEEIVEPTAVRSAEDEARRRYEEENFTRLPETKRERALKRQQIRAAAGTMDLVASSDFRAVESLLGNLAHDDDDDDDADNERARKAPRALSVSRAAGAAAEDDDVNDDLYMEMRDGQSRKRALKKASYAFPQRFTPAEAPSVAGARSATRAMIKNRGLTPHRPKDAKNPRKHIRDKYEAKVKARKGQVRDMRAEGDAYQGEKSGVRSNLVRSRVAGS